MHSWTFLSTCTMERNFFHRTFLSRVVSGLPNFHVFSVLEALNGICRICYIALAREGNTWKPRCSEERNCILHLSVSTNRREPLCTWLPCDNKANETLLQLAVPENRERDHVDFSSRFSFYRSRKVPLFPEEASREFRQFCFVSPRVRVSRKVFREWNLF